MEKKKREKRKLIDKVLFTAALAEYSNEYKRLNPVKVIRPNKPIRPKVSNYIGKCVMILSVNLAKCPNFSGYTWKDEMINDGIENFLRYMHNFDPEKTNAHAYATMIMRNSFIQRITKEKEQLRVKNRLIDNLTHEHMFELQENDEGEYINAYVETMQKINLENPNYKPYDSSKKVRKNKVKAENENSLEDFLV